MKKLQMLAGRGRAQRRDLKLTCTTYTNLTTAPSKVIVSLSLVMLADELRCPSHACRGGGLPKHTTDPHAKSP